MQPAIWRPSVTLSQQEEQIVKKIRKATLFVFLREHRHELLDEAFQQELTHLYQSIDVRVRDCSWSAQIGTGAQARGRTLGSAGVSPERSRTGILLAQLRSAPLRLCLVPALLPRHGSLLRLPDIPWEA